MVYRNGKSSVVNRHSFDAARIRIRYDQTFHFDADPGPVPAPRFTHVRKSEKIFRLLFTAVPIYIVLSFSSASLVLCLSIFRSVPWYNEIFWKK
jgi:hypothetical protein